MCWLCQRSKEMREEGPINFRPIRDKKSAKRERVKLQEETWFTNSWEVITSRGSPVTTGGWRGSTEPLNMGSFWSSGKPVCQSLLQATPSSSAWLSQTLLPRGWEIFHLSPTTMKTGISVVCLKPQTIFKIIKYKWKGKTYHWFLFLNLMDRVKWLIKVS